MKERNRIVAILLAIMMVVTYMPAMAFAAAEDETEPAVTVEAQEEAPAEDAVQEEPAETDAQAEEPAAAEEEDEAAEEPAPAKEDADTLEAAPGKLTPADPAKLITKAEIAGSDELLGQFFEAEVDKALGKKAAGSKLRAAKSPRKSMLNDTEQYIYDEIVANLENIASGNASRSEMVIDLKDALADYLDEDGNITYESLGLHDAMGVFIYDEEEDNWVISDEAREKLFDTSKIVDAVMVDQPYCLYWYDKLSGCWHSFNALLDPSDGVASDAYFNDDPALTLKFTVAEDYRAEDGDQYDVDTEKTARAAEAAQNAENILAEYSSMSDIDKLYAFKEAICSRTSYNHDAAMGNYDHDYGNPWQMIWVFDDDESTNVVCEGYSKAFQFLCDKTDFDNDSIECHTVSGEMGGDDATGAGAHMWNILHMDDNRNYIADLTNCDEGSVGADSQLFLTGAEEGGSVDGGYTYICNDSDSIYYTYDIETRNQYSDKELKMSVNDYGEGEMGSLRFEPAEPAELVEDVDGHKSQEEDSYFHYYSYSIFYKEGNKIIINDEEEYTCRYDYDSGYWLYSNSEGEALDRDQLRFTDNQSYDNRWSIDNPGIITVTYMDKSCTITVNIIKNPIIGITFTPVNEYVDLIENIDGYYDEYHDIFRYRYGKIINGDKLTIHYSDRDDITYEYDGEYDAFVNQDDEDDILWRATEEGDGGWTCYADESEQWTVTEGDEYYGMYFTYRNVAAFAKKIRIKPNPVESISFSRNGENRIEVVEGKDIDEEWEYEEEEDKYIRYIFWFDYGDRITLNNTDGTVEVYEYKNAMVGDSEDVLFVNVEDETKTLDGYYLRFYAVPRQSAENQWEVGGSYKAAVEYLGKTAEVNVDVVPNPITKIEYKREGKYPSMELVENMNGYMECDYDDNDQRVDYYYYWFPGFNVGDTLTMTINGEEVEYVMRDGVRVDDYYERAFVNVDDSTDVIHEYDFETYSNQRWSNPWEKGGEGYFYTSKYYGVKFTIPVEIIENPVSAIDFSREGYDEDHPIELTEGIDAYINSDGGNNRWFEYFLTFKNGDTIRITDPQGGTSDYNAVPYNEDWDEAKWFENNEGKKINLYDIGQNSKQSWDNQWLPGDGTHAITLDYYTRTTDVNVRIKENSVKTLSFNRPGNEGAPIELFENGDGYWQGSIFRYEIRFKEGDELYITYAGTDDPVKYVAQTGADGKVYQFVADGSVPPGAESEISIYELYFRHNASYKLFEDGETDEDTIMLMYQGKWADVPVKLAENPVEGIEFVWKKGGDRLELVENKDGYDSFVDDGNEIVSCFRYELNYAEGDILKVKYAGISTPVSYVYSVDEDLAVFRATGNVPEGKPDMISVEDIYRFSDQDYYYPWTIGNDYEIELEYLGNIFTVPVTIVGDVDPGVCTHTYVNVVEKPATCSESGIRDHYRCINCGSLFIKEGEDYVETTSEELSIPATGQHTAGTAVRENEVAATCSTKGHYDEVVYCTVCGKELSRQTREIPVSDNHTAGTPVRENEIAASCSAKGHYDEVVYCTVCGKELSRQIREIPVNDSHTAGTPVRENEVAASCKSEGSYEEVIYCKDCHKELSRTKKTVDKTAHTWGAASYSWNVDYTEVTATHECNVCNVTETETAKRASATVIKEATSKEKGLIRYTSESFAKAGFDAQTIDVETELSAEEKAVADAIDQANDQTNDAAEKANAAENSSDENVVSEAEDSAAKAAELAAKAETAAEDAFNKAEAAYEKALNSGDAAAIETAKENLDVATNNLATAKVLKAAATSSLAKAKKAAARVASEKAAAAGAAAQKAKSPADAEELRKEAEAQAAIAAEKASSAESASADASKAAADLGELVNKIEDPAVKEAVNKEKAKADTSANAASESAKGAGTSSEEAKASETKAEEAVQEAKRKGVYDKTIPKMTIKSKTSKKTSITIKWKWTTAGKKKLKKSKATKYEIWVCPNTKFAKADTIIKTCSKSKTSYTVKGLKKNKKYYFKIRAIKTVKGVKYAGPWSTRKYIKTKKK